MISKETIKELQECAKTEIGANLSESEALEMLSNLAGYFSTLADINHRIFTKGVG